MVNKNKAIFFDRDGVLNKTFIKNSKPFAPKNFKDFKIVSSAYKTLNYLVSLNYLIFVITNQPDVGNGLVKKDIIEKMHDIILKRLPVKKVFVCYHSQDQNCFCRKPKTGMIEEAKKKFDLNLENSFLVGDRFSDIEAGNKSKLKTIMLGNGYGEYPSVNPDFKIKRLEEVNKIIVN
jgi:D-glycero-D-manno-heptose 1,7-bisphosphate phosphatase